MTELGLCRAVTICAACVAGAGRWLAASQGQGLVRALAACCAVMLATGSHAQAPVSSSADAVPVVLPSEQRDAVVRDWFAFVARVNRTSPMEGAGSHGSVGVVLGCGASGYQMPSNNPVVQTQVTDATPAAGGGAAERQQFYMPRIWLAKGLPLPVDVGVTAGTAADGLFTQVAGYAQWTVYEALARPALALRGSFGRVHGLAGTEFSSVAVDAVGSMGLTQYFTAYATYGVADQRGSLVIDPADKLAFLLKADDGDQGTTISRRWYQTQGAIGLKVAVYPPFMTVTLESTASSSHERSVAVKLGVGL